MCSTYHIVLQYEWLYIIFLMYCEVKKRMSHCCWTYTGTDWHSGANMNSAMNLFFLSIQKCHFLDCYLWQYECQMKVEVCRVWNMAFGMVRLGLTVSLSSNTGLICSHFVFECLCHLWWFVQSLLWFKWSWDFFDAVWKMDVEFQCILLILNSWNHPTQLKGR